MNAAIKPMLKGTPWKWAGGFAFAQFDHSFVDAYVAVYRNAERSTLQLRLKPMSLDPILWDIFELPDNQRAPLSFRARGVFTCGGLPVLEQEIESPGDAPETVAGRFVQACVEQGPALLHEAGRRPFSEQVREHPNQRERGAYAITLVTALIAESRYEQARALAQKYVAGELSSVNDFVADGRSFHQFALDWLDARSRAN